MTSDDRDPVDVLAEEFAERLRRGERPSVSEYAAAHPKHAEQIRQVLPAVAQMEQLKNFRKAAPGANADHLPDRLGDFRIVRELGRGGMGVVFEAMQESLARRVALKVLASHAQLDPERRERFVREAKAAARLHHTNIVPVFGVGEQDGLPYYVMQLIPGHGLNAIVNRWKDAAQRETKQVAGRTESTVVTQPPIRSKPSRKAPDVAPVPIVAGPALGDWSFVAGIGVRVAQALHYAHGKGVLHRDVKPANLLLDDRGEVWVVDFGLAKLANYRGLTATGHIVGTLQYMAPECLHGAADARSDVYGLGATLYELLTLAAPFEGDSPAQIMKQIADTTPTAPRRIDSHIPRDLETIVLKAMAREPGRRYASARLFAEDLQAFLDDRPIRARRETLPERAWRWSRHHPAVAALSCCTIAALLLAATLGWTGYVRTKSALASEAKKRDEAEAASAKLEANLELSLKAFEKVFVAAGGDEFRPMFGPRAGSPPGGPLGNDAADKAAVLEAVLDFYDEFADRNTTNVRLRTEAGKAHRRVAEMHQIFARHEKAAVSFRRAFALLESVRAERPDDLDARFELMLCYSNSPVGAAGAEPQLLKAVELGEAFKTSPRRWSVGTAYSKLGWAREEAKNASGAEAAYLKAIALYAPEPEGPPRPPNFTMEQIVARQRLASFLVKRDELQEARRTLEKAAEEARPHLGGPQNRYPRETQAATLRQLAEVLQRQGEDATASRLRLDAQRLMEPPPPFGGSGPHPKGPPPKKP